MNTLMNELKQFNLKLNKDGLKKLEINKKYIMVRYLIRTNYNKRSKPYDSDYITDDANSDLGLESESESSESEPDSPVALNKKTTKKPIKTPIPPPVKLPIKKTRKKNHIIRDKIVFLGKFIGYGDKYTKKYHNESDDESDYEFEEDSHSEADSDSETDYGSDSDSGAELKRSKKSKKVKTTKKSKISKTSKLNKIFEKSNNEYCILNCDCDYNKYKYYIYMIDDTIDTQKFLNTILFVCDNIETKRNKALCVKYSKKMLSIKLFYNTIPKIYKSEVFDNNKKYNLNKSFIFYK